MTLLPDNSVSYRRADKDGKLFRPGNWELDGDVLKVILPLPWAKEGVTWTFEFNFSGRDSRLLTGEGGLSMDLTEQKSTERWRLTRAVTLKKLR